MKPSYDFGYKTLEQVVEQINNSPVHGFEAYTSEFLAAAYACDAQNESGYEISKNTIEAHLDVLSENGAKFDYQTAVKLALAPKYLMNPATGSVDTEENWLSEMPTWEGDQQSQFDSLIEVEKDVDGDWVEVVNG